MPLLDAIEHRATAEGIPVDSRIDQGRNRRHALRQTIIHERFDTIVVAAASNGSPCFEAEDIAWLLDNAEGEIVALRPGADDRPIEVLPPVDGPGRTPTRRGRNGKAPDRDRSRAGEVAMSR